MIPEGQALLEALFAVWLPVPEGRRRAQACPFHAPPLQLCQELGLGTSVQRSVQLQNWGWQSGQKEAHPLLLSHVLFRADKGFFSVITEMGNVSPPSGEQTQVPAPSPLLGKVGHSSRHVANMIRRGGLFSVQAEGSPPLASCF